MSKYFVRMLDFWATPSWRFTRLHRISLWRIWVFEPPSRNRQRRLPSKSDTLGGITEEEPLVPNQKHLWFNLSLTQLVSSSVTNNSVKWNLPINTLQRKWQSLLERVAINTLPSEILPANTDLRVMELLKGQTHKILVSRSFHTFSLQSNPHTWRSRVTKCRPWSSAARDPAGASDH